MKSVTILPVLVLLSLILFVLTFQKFAIGQSIYPLPPTSSELSMVNYPEKVKESLKSVVGITMDMYFKNNGLPMFLGHATKATGTGYMFKPGLFISARHILIAGFERMFERMRIQLPTFNKYGIPSSNTLDYLITGTTNINEKAQDFKLNIIGAGAPDKFEDFIILQSDNFPPELKSIEYDDKFLNVDEIVYNAGYVHYFMTLNSYPANTPVLFDIIRTSFQGRIHSVIKDLPINKLGVSVLYRIEIKLEQGFSGGPILNSEGKVVAITILRTDNFLYAIPIKDINLFIEKLKKDGVIPPL